MAGGKANLVEISQGRSARIHETGSIILQLAEKRFRQNMAWSENAPFVSRIKIGFLPTSTERKKNYLIWIQKWKQSSWRIWPSLASATNSSQSRNLSPKNFSIKKHLLQKSINLATKIGEIYLHQKPSWSQKNLGGNQKTRRGGWPLKSLRWPQWKTPEQ